MRVEVAALTDVGCVRSNNEDHFGYDLAARLFVVCDGMGGMAAGERASSTAVQEFLEAFAQDSESGTGVDERLHRAILHANTRVFVLAQQEELCTEWERRW